MCTIIVGDVNTPLSILVRKSRQKITKEIEDLNNSINLVDLTGTPHNSNRIHIILKCTWNFFQDRSYVSPQNKSQKI